MTIRRSSLPFTSTLIAAVLLLAGCAGNEAYRTENLSDNDAAPFESCNVEDHEFKDVCDQSYYSTYSHHESGVDYDFDLAFVEFTERGAVFDQKRMDDVIKNIRDHAESETGVTTVVYVHGWKNNAAADNGNVKSFREMLAKTAKVQHRLAKRTGYKNRKLVGVYVGWRGSSLEVQPFHQLTYWDRKAVAEEVGKGGVTELLLRLERILRSESKEEQERDPNKNLYLVTGHSLGAAVLLTGLNEIFLERIIDKQQPNGCIDPTDSFGHGVALLNPAIETSEILELKQLVAQNCFQKNQERMMHVISSDADQATTKIFKAAQWLGLVIGWNQAQFERDFKLPDGTNRRITFDETKMDTTTVGNYAPFLTGYLFAEGSKKAKKYGFINCDDGDCIVDDCAVTSTSEIWNYVPFKGQRGEDCFSRVSDEGVHVPIGNHEPLAFIKTDEDFIGDHNDVFNENVAAYMATIVAENRFIRARAHSNNAEPLDTAGEGPKACFRETSEGGLAFDFGLCFDAYHQEFCKLDEDKSSLGRHETCEKRSKPS